MSNIIKSHGFKFLVDQAGFLASNAMDDFHVACENLENALDALSADEVAALHAGSIFVEERGEFADPSAFDRLDKMANDAVRAATSEWYDPSAAFIMVSAVP